MPKQSSLSWRQTRPGRWERGIDNFDKFYAFIHAVGQGRPDKQNWFVTTGIKIQLDCEDFVSAIKAAWIAMRHRHPVYAALIEGERWVYHVADDQELVDWLEETFVVHDIDQTARERFPFDANPAKRVVLHVLPRSLELVLDAPHTHVDAKGCATFFDSMLHFLANPSSFDDLFDGNEGSRLAVPLTISAEVPEPSEKQMKAYEANLANFLSEFPTLRVKNDNVNAIAQRTRIQWLQFSEEETKAIAGRCRELGLSVSAAAQAAVSHSARIHGQIEKNTHASFAIYDARDAIDPDAYPHSELVAGHVFAIPAVFPLTPDNFIETARQARQVYKSYKENDSLRATSSRFGIDIPTVLSAPMPEGMPVAADFQLSSIGILDNYLGNNYQAVDDGSTTKVEVQDLWISLEMLSPNIACEMWTYCGKLMIESVYNEAFHREDSVTHLLRLVHDQLSQGLGLNLRFDARFPGQEDFVLAAKRLKWAEGANGGQHVGLVGAKESAAVVAVSTVA